MSSPECIIALAVHVAVAVSYEARARGVTRFFRAREALNACPEIVIVQVPTAHGKSDMGVYRDFGARTLKLIGEVCGSSSAHSYQIF